MNNSPYTPLQQLKDSAIASQGGTVVNWNQPAFPLRNIGALRYLPDVRRDDLPMKRDSEHRIVVLLNAALKGRGWPAIRLCGLPLAYAKDRVVTPYFSCSSIPLKPYGKYTIEEVIGVIHQGFEVNWMTNKNRRPQEPGFAAILDILNLPDLRARRRISSDSQLEADVESFCSALTDVLDRMPQNEQELVVVYGKSDMGGIPWDTFSGYAYRAKFQAFQEFIGCIAKV